MSERKEARVLRVKLLVELADVDAVRFEYEGAL
jgi:hypothetical protein